MKEQLMSIAQYEGLDETKLNGDQINAILDVSSGDMHWATTVLQSVQALIAGAAGGNMNDHCRIKSVPPKVVVDKLYQALLTTQFEQVAIKEIIADGYLVQLLLSKLLDKWMSKDYDDNLDELGWA
jgi:DNA polymerase III delta prime subunit